MAGNNRAADLRRSAQIKTITLVQYKFSRRDAEAQRRGSQGEKRKWGMILEVQKFGNSLTKWDVTSLVFDLSWYSLCVSAPPRDLFWTVMIQH
jgi:hypothetical protein